MLAVCSLLVGTAVEGANLVGQFAPLVLLDGGHRSSAFTVEQAEALASMPLALLTIGYSIGQVIYALSLLSIAYLIVRSTFLPRIIGGTLAIGALCYLVYSFATFLSPGFADHLVPYIQLPSGVGEGSLCLWLLIVGLNVSRWQNRAAATASPWVPGI